MSHDSCVWIALISLLSTATVAQDMSVDEGPLRLRHRVNVDLEQTPQTHPRSTEPRGWLHDRDRGWFFYEDPAPPVKPDEQPPSGSAPSADPLQELEAFQTKVERSMAKAVLHPTEENVLDFMQLSSEAQQRGVMFADVFQRAVWKTPALDPAMERPISGVGLRSYTDQRNEARSQTLRDVAQTHGLFFFFRGDCQYCHELVPLLATFASTYDFKIIPLSLDGSQMEGLGPARYEPELVRRFKVQTVPAVFLVDPNAGDVQPVAYGAVSLSDLEDRIYRLMKLDPGKMLFDPYQERQIPLTDIGQERR